MKKPNIDKFKKVVKNNWFIFKYVLDTVPAYALLVPAIPTIHAVLQFFEFRYMAKYMIDCIEYQKPFIYAFFYLAAVFISVVSFLLIANRFKAYHMQKHQAKLSKKMQLEIYEKATKMDLACYDNPDFYTDFVWAMNEATKRTDAVLGTIAKLCSSIALIFTSGLFMILNDNISMIFVAVTFILTFAVNLKISKIRFNLDLELKPLQRKRDYINRVFYLNDYSKEIRLNGIKGKLYSEFSKSNDDLTGLIKKRTKKLAFLTFVAQFVFNSLILDGIYILYLLFKTVVVKALSYGTVAALFQTSWALKEGLSTFAQVIPEFNQNSLYIEKLMNFLSYDPKIKNGVDVKEMPNTPSTLEFKNVHFSYKTSDTSDTTDTSDTSNSNILKNINLTIKPKEKVAIVGYNGAGKTTLIKLIMRLYDVTAGEICYDGHNIKEYDLQSYRDNCGAVFQDYQLFAASISENIIMDTNSTDQMKLYEAIQKSGFTDKLISLDNGINTKLTREFDDTGINLSGGEAQKVAIARVLYKNCNMIILDEPSSALDPISEYHLNETIKEEAKEKSVIFISHRLSTTRMADRIYMLENGEIIEQGSHDELMALDGKYAYMFNLQAEKYRSLIV